jgi:hypothetical protein
MARDETNGCTGTGKPALTYTITDKGVLTVSGTPSAIVESAFRGRDELTDVRLPDSVVRIEDHAFADCRNLRFVEPGRDCRSIGDGAFRGCGELFSVDWEESLIGSIGSRTFDGCCRLCEFLALPRTLKSIGYAAFGNCTGLKRVEFFNSPVHIADSAFRGTGIRKVYAPWSKPLPIGEKVFPDNAVIYIPKGTRAAYEETDGWNGYTLTERDRECEIARYFDGLYSGRPVRLSGWELSLTAINYFIGERMEDGNCYYFPEASLEILRKHISMLRSMLDGGEVPDNQVKRVRQALENGAYILETSSPMEQSDI